MYMCVHAHVLGCNNECNSVCSAQLTCSLGSSSGLAVTLAMISHRMMPKENRSVWKKKTEKKAESNSYTELTDIDIHCGDGLSLRS